MNLTEEQKARILEDIETAIGLPPLIADDEIPLKEFISAWGTHKDKALERLKIAAEKGAGTLREVRLQNGRVTHAWKCK
jgi:hypothetical protein